MSPRATHAPARGGLLAAAAGFLLEPAPDAGQRTRVVAPADAGPLLAASALSDAVAALADPAGAVANRAVLPPPVGPRRPVVAIVGVGARCGTTTVARGLAAALAARGPATVVNGAAPRGSTGSRAARRMARVLGPLAGAPARPVGRICLVAAADPLAVVDAAGGLAPVVLDAGAGGGARAAVRLADHVVLVVPDAAEPALPFAVSRSLAEVGPDPVCAVPRGDPERWEDRDVLVLPDSRAGARRSRRGRVPAGELGRAILELADRCGGEER